MNIHGNPVLVVVDFQGGPLDGDGDGYYPGGPAGRSASPWCGSRRSTSGT
jgi:hypothetical protein